MRNIVYILFIALFALSGCRERRDYIVSVNGHLLTCEMLERKVAMMEKVFMKANPDASVKKVKDQVRKLRKSYRKVFESDCILTDYLAAEGVLARHAVGRTQVEDNLGPLNGQLGRWRQWRPEVLAHLDAEREIGRAEQQVIAEWYVAREHVHLVDIEVAACGEPALLVELGRVGEVDLGHCAQHFAIGHHEGAIVEVVVHLERCAHNNHHGCLFRHLTNLLQCLHGILLKLVHEKEVGTRVPRHAKFGETEHLHALFGCLANLLNNLFVIL